MKSSCSGEGNTLCLTATHSLETRGLLGIAGGVPIPRIATPGSV